MVGRATEVDGKAWTTPVQVDAWEPKWKHDMRWTNPSKVPVGWKDVWDPYESQPNLSKDGWKPHVEEGGNRGSPHA